MSGIKYSKEQIEELQKNKYVRKASEKYITFTLECKIEFLKLSEKGVFYREIFKKLGFPEYIFKSQITERAYQRWKRNLKKGEIEKTKGKPKKEKIDFDNMNKDQYIEYLEAKVAYYEEIKKYIDSGLP